MKNAALVVLGVGLSLFGLSMMTSGCAADSATTADDEPAADESEVVGASSFPLLETSFGLKPGVASKDVLRSGDCYKALVLPVEGIPTHKVKPFLNGAIIYPSDSNPSESVCVDTYEYKVSFSHSMLDAVVRFDLGRFERKLTDAKTPEGAELHFAKGVMRVFTGVPEARRFDNARKKTSDFPPTASTSIAGSIIDLKLKGIELHNRHQGQTTADITVPGELVAIAHRYATQHAVKKGYGSMTNDAIGAFTRVVKADGDVGSFFQELGLKNGALRVSSTGQPLAPPNNDITDALEIFPASPIAQGEKPLASCTRNYLPDAVPVPEYTCTGL